MSIIIIDKMSNTCDRCQAIDSIIENEGELVCCKCGLGYSGGMIADEYETYAGEENQIKRVGPPEKKEEAREPGTNLIIKEYGTKKIIRTYLKRTKIERNMQGRNFNHIIAALYYYALRIKNMAQNYKEVARQFPSLTERQIRKAFNNIKWHISSQTDEDKMIKIEKNLIQMYIGGNIEKYDAKMLSYEIIKNINDNALLEGKSPNTVANKVTIIKAFEEIKCDLNKIVPQKYSDKINQIKMV